MQKTTPHKISKNLAINHTRNGKQNTSTTHENTQSEEKLNNHKTTKEE